jgi:hypothetical protein
MPYDEYHIDSGFDFNYVSDVPNSPYMREFNEIDEKEIIMFHGTYRSELIILNGFDHMMCNDSSMGRGIYISPCIGIACAFGDKIIMCKVKLGKTKIFEEYDKNYKPVDFDSGIYKTNGWTEYVIYDSSRIIPYKIYEIQSS